MNNSIISTIGPKLINQYKGQGFNFQNCVLRNLIQEIDVSRALEKIKIYYSEKARSAGNSSTVQKPVLSELISTYGLIFLGESECEYCGIVPHVTTPPVRGHGPILDYKCVSCGHEKFKDICSCKNCNYERKNISLEIQRRVKEIQELLSSQKVESLRPSRSSGRICELKKGIQTDSFEITFGTGDLMELTISVQSRLAWRAHP